MKEDGRGRDGASGDDGEWTVEGGWWADKQRDRPSRQAAQQAATHTPHPPRYLLRYQVAEHHYQTVKNEASRGARPGWFAGRWAPSWGGVPFDLPGLAVAQRAAPGDSGTSVALVRAGTGRGWVPRKQGGRVFLLWICVGGRVLGTGCHTRSQVPADGDGG